MATAEIRGLEFVGGSGDATYTMDSITGWLDGVETKQERIDRPSDDGEFDVPGYLAGRMVSITGLILADTDAGYEQAIAALAAIPATELSELTVVTALGSTSAMVRRSGKPDIAPVVYGQSARFRVQFWAADPRRYGASHTFGPGSSVTGIGHDGNFKATPVLTVSGSSGGGYTVTGPGGKTITVTQALVSGHPHTIDLSTGGLYVDGARVAGGMSVFRPWSVPVGSTVSASVSAGSLSVTVLDTFS